MLSAILHFCIALQQLVHFALTIARRKTMQRPLTIDAASERARQGNKRQRVVRARVHSDEKASGGGSLWRNVSHMIRDRRAWARADTLSCAGEGAHVSTAAARRKLLCVCFCETRSATTRDMPLTKKNRTRNVDRFIWSHSGRDQNLTNNSAQSTQPSQSPSPTRPVDASPT
jgi:hypothetical protein